MNLRLPVGRISLLLICCFLASTACASRNSARASIQERHLRFENVNYSYVVYVPKNYDSAQALPAILLLHGRGGQGRDMLENWKDYAEKDRILLVAPTLPYSNDFEEQIPRLFPALMDSARAEWNIDAHRMYVFGYSAGGYCAFDAMTLLSNYFAGGGVFAAIISPDYDWIVEKAQRKIPIAYYIGDSDQAFKLAQTRRTRDLLQKSGFPVHYVEIRNQDHAYYRVSNSVNEDAWKFITSHPPE